MSTKNSFNKINSLLDSILTQKVILYNSQVKEATQVNKTYILTTIIGKIKNIQTILDLIDTMFVRNTLTKIEQSNIQTLHEWSQRNKDNLQSIMKTLFSIDANNCSIILPILFNIPFKGNGEIKYDFLHKCCAGGEWTNDGFIDSLIYSFQNKKKIFKVFCIILLNTMMDRNKIIYQITRKEKQKMFVYFVCFVILVYFVIFVILCIFCYVCMYDIYFVIFVILCMYDTYFVCMIYTLYILYTLYV